MLSTFRRALIASAALFLAVVNLPAYAASWDACFAALEQNQPAQAVKEAKALLKQKALPKETAHKANLCLGRAWFVQGDFKQALLPLREATRLAASPKQRGTAHSWLGNTLRSMGELDEAAAAHGVELAAAIQLGDAGKEATALNNLGNIAYQREQSDEALRLYTRSLALQTEESAKANVLNNIAAIHDNRGAYALAVDALQQAIAIDRKLGEQRDLAMYLLSLGNTYHKMQRWPDADQALNEGLRIARAVGDRYWEGMGYKYFGAAYRDAGDPAKARENFNIALKIFREIGAKREEQDTLNSMGRLK